jgi:glutathione S-transferase
MPLTFYYASGSPYAWRVWLALEHKHLEYDLKTMSFAAGDLRTPEFLAINPRHRVPALVDDDFSLYESAAIVEYLDEKYPGPMLFPGDAQHRAIVRRLVREAEEYFADAMDELLHEILFKPREKWSTDRIQRGRQRLADELAVWEGLVRGEFVAGPASAADYTLYPMVALTLRCDKKKPDLAVASLVGPRLSAWMERVEALPYFRKTWPPHWK